MLVGSGWDTNRNGEGDGCWDQGRPGSPRVYVNEVIIIIDVNVFNTRIRFIPGPAL